MAIDKNSKAYQSLITNGYTDEQITQMHDSVASGENAQNVVQNTQPANYDPMADLNPEYIANMDMNKQISGANQSFSQYWDDSSRDKQDTRGWLNEKYTWEWVKTSDINYNPDITTKDLNPNFVYGKQSQVYGTDHPGYISQRNDDIASALYNEWLTSREDVARFLMSQNWFMNSTEEDRLNTIESVWKRLWAIAWQNKPDPSKAEQILTDTSGELYGKVTADEWNPSEWIQTLADENSAFKAMQESRVNNLKSMISNNPADIAALELSGLSPFWEQTMRDARQYYPEFVAEIEAEKKRQLAQENVQSIASGWELTTAADKVDTNTANTSYAVNSSSSTTTATQLLKWIDSILESSDTAKSAEDLMGSIEKDMATLKNRLKNLRQEANATFKWDVPDYLVNAYINNKTQEIQNQLSILEDRYNAAYNRYKTEVANAQWQAEYDLKKQSLALDEWKAKNWATTGSTWTAKMRTERNNNPTAMTTDVAKMLWGVLWVDYEIWDAFTTAGGSVLYTAKLIGDPIETTIRLIDRWIANGIDPFYRANWQGRWSYISKIWITKEKWLNMSPSEKADIIAQMLKHEWGSMENMLYYTQSWWSSSSDGYDITYQSAYEKYLSWNYNKAWLETQCKTMWVTEQQFWQQAQAYKIAKENGELDIQDDILANGWKWTRNDGRVFDFSKSTLYKWLSERDKEAVQQLLNNNISKQYINSNRTQYDNPSGIFSAVNQIDPTWNEALFERRKAAEKKREQGKQWGWVSRNESAMATAKELYGLAYLLDDATVKVLWSEYNVRTLKDLANLAKKELWDPRISYLATLVYWLEEEAAGALKWWNAANSYEDVQNMERLLDLGMSQSQLKSAVAWIARLLYLKDESEVRDLSKITYMKEDSTWSQSVTDWMYYTLWMKDIPLYYNYTPTWSSNLTQEELDALYEWI